MTLQRSLVLSWISLALATSVYGESVDLLGPLDKTERRNVPSYVLNEAPVKVNLQALGDQAENAADRLALTLDDLSVQAHLQRAIDNRSGSFTWIGTIDEDPLGSIVLVARQGIVHGSIRVFGRLFDLRRIDSSHHVLQEIDESSPLLREEPPTEVTPDMYSTPSRSSTPIVASEASSEKGAGGDTQIDLMVVYTPQAQTAAGGTTIDIENRIDLGLAEANISYNNSDVAIDMNLVHVAPVTYNDSGSSSTDRTRLRTDGDGFLDEVHDWRDAYGADIVQMIIGDGGCGIAYIMTSVGVEFEEFAFCVTQYSCISPNYTFSHEMGHIQSARHDYDADGTVGSPFAFNHGYFSPTSVWRTVMSYNNCAGSPCQRQLYWSNPQINHPTTGEPMGIADGQPQAADNHLTLNTTRTTVAAFRTAASLVFQDGFESGNTGQWSSTSP